MPLCPNRERSANSVVLRKRPSRRFSLRRFIQWPSTLTLQHLDLVSWSYQNPCELRPGSSERIEHDFLGAYSLLEIVSYFKPRASTTHRSHFPINYTSPSDELIALSAVSRLARSLLAPHVHAVLSIGTKPTTGRKKSPLLKLKNGHSLLSCVR